MRQASRSRGPTALSMPAVRVLATRRTAGQLSATPKPSMPSAAAYGTRRNSSAAVSAVPVAVDTVTAVPPLTASPARCSSWRRRAASSASAATMDEPNPSSSTLRKPSGVCEPRSAATMASATTREPTSARPGNPPPMPALITSM